MSERRLIYIGTVAQLAAAQQRLTNSVPSAEIIAPLSADGDSPTTHYGLQIDVSEAQYAALSNGGQNLNDVGEAWDGEVFPFDVVLIGEGLSPVTDYVAGNSRAGAFNVLPPIFL